MATQIRGTAIYDGSVSRADLNVLDSGQAVIRRILEVANSGIKVTNDSTGADPGTGDVKLAVDYVITQAKLNGTGLVRMAGAVVSYDNTTYYHSGNLPAYPTTLPPTAHTHTLLNATDNYIWLPGYLPNDYAMGIQSSFVQPETGWPGYGSVMNMRTYVGGGGSLQLYTPYGPNNGGNTLRVRFGNYDVDNGNSWTGWKALWHDGNSNISTVDWTARIMTATKYFIGARQIIADNYVTTPNTNLWIGTVNTTITGTGDQGDYNLGIGGNTLISNTTGNQNIAIGFGTLKLNTTGNYNYAIGNNCLRNNTSGQQNMAMGGYALDANTTGSYSIGIGVSALKMNNANGNIGIGGNAIRNNVDGLLNTAIGYNAGSVTGGALNNTSILNSVFIGAQTKAFAIGGDNEIVIGYLAIGHGSNTATWGNTAILNHYFSGSVTAPTFIGNLTGAADKATYLKSLSHPDGYWISNTWDGVYWQLTSNHPSPVNVGHADAATNAGWATNAGNATTAVTATTADKLTALRQMNATVNTDTKGESGINYFSGGTGNPYSDGALYQQAYAPALSSWGSQIMQDYRTGRLAVRGLNAGNWTTWLAIPTTSDIANFATTGHTHNYEPTDGTIFRYGGFGVNANDLSGNRSAFTYSLGAPHTGPIAHFEAANYGMQINGVYNSGGNEFSVRTRNGDVAAWNGWRKLWHDGNFTPGNYSTTGHFHDYAVHNANGTNHIDYARYVYNNGAYSGTGWVDASELGVRYASTAGSASDSSKLNGLTGSQYWNNTGNVHGSFQDFASIPGFGNYFMQAPGAADSPQTGSQYYTTSVGLGNDYPFTQYVLQTAISRDSPLKYHYVRVKEASTWGAWSKIAAGYADTAGSVGKVVNYIPHTNTTADGTANWFYTDYGYIALGPMNAGTAHIYTNLGTFYFNKDLLVNGSTVYHSGNFTPGNYLPLTGGTLTGALYGTTVTATGLIKGQFLHSQNGVIRADAATDTCTLSNEGGSWLKLNAQGINTGDWTNKPTYGQFITGSDYDLSFRIQNVERLHIHKTTGAVTLTGPLKMFEGSYIGTIRFGSNEGWACGISQRDAGCAEMRIWAKNVTSGSIYFATGYDGELAAATLPTDGMCLKANKLGIGSFSSADIPTEKLHIKGNVLATGSVTVGTELTVGANFKQQISHGENHRLELSAAENGLGNGAISLYTWISEPGMTWTGAAIARNMYNTTSFPRANTNHAGQMMRFIEGDTIEFVIEKINGARTTPLIVQPGGVFVNGVISSTGSGTFEGGGFHSRREIKDIHPDWDGNALHVISKFKIRDFNYKNIPDYDRTLGFIVDEIPEEIGDYVLSGATRNAINTYTLHGLSFKAHQETKSELELQAERIIVLENRVMELEGRVN